MKIGTNSPEGEMLANHLKTKIDNSSSRGAEEMRTGKTPLYPLG